MPSVRNGHINRRLYDQLIKTYLEEVQNIFAKCVNENKKKSRYSRILLEFQDALKEISVWSNHDKKRLCDRVLRNIDIRIDHEMLYYCFLDIARMVWKEAYLLDTKNKDKIQIQKDLIRLETIIGTCVSDLLESIHSQQYHVTLGEDDANEYQNEEALCTEDNYEQEEDDDDDEEDDNEGESEEENEDEGESGDEDDNEGESEEEDDNEDESEEEDDDEVETVDESKTIVHPIDESDDESDDHSKNEEGEKDNDGVQVASREIIEDVVEDYSKETQTHENLDDSESSSSATDEEITPQILNLDNIKVIEASHGKHDLKPQKPEKIKTSEQIKVITINERLMETKKAVKDKLKHTGAKHEKQKSPSFF